MRRAAGLLLVLAGACSREPIADDATPGRDAQSMDTAPSSDAASRDASTQVDVATGDIATDGAATDGVETDIPVVVDPRDVFASSDVSDAGFDVGSPDLGTRDAADVGRVTDVNVTDRCGFSFYTAVEPAAATIAADDAGDADAVDARTADGTDAGDADGRVDGDAPDATLDQVCTALKAEWRMFVQQNDNCATATDCTWVEGSRSCDGCGPLGQGIGDGSGTGVAVAAGDQVQSYIDRWRSTGCEFWTGFCIADARPSTSVSCEQGKCVANHPSCNPPPPPPEPCR